MTNEAAERLRQWLAVDGRYVDAHPLIDNLVDAALTAERKATVERIRAAILAYWDAQHPLLEHQTEQWAADLWAERNDLEGIILDAEAARKT